MTKARVREILRYQIPKYERIVDICIYKDMVDVITVTKYHTVCQQCFRIVDDNLEFSSAKMATF